MKYLALSLGLFACLPWAAPATAEEAPPSRFFEVYDANGDGRVTPEELGAGGDVFRLLDRDEDGAITPEDLGHPEALRPKRPQPRPDAAPRGPEGGAGRGPGAGREQGPGRGLGRGPGRGPGNGSEEGPGARGGRGRDPEARAARWKAMDLDGDGKVSREEFRGPERFFDLLDANSDGFVDEAEAKAARERRGGPGGGQGRGPDGRPGGEGAERRREHLKAMDTDGDGRVSKEEWQGRMPFERLDQNGDGFLDAKDREGMRRPASDAPGRGGDGKAPGQRRRGRGLSPEALSRFDTDGDGKVSADEFPGSQERFERLDLDHDGFLTKADLPEAPASKPDRQATAPDRPRPVDTNGDGKIFTRRVPRVLGGVAEARQERRRVAQPRGTPGEGRGGAGSQGTRRVADPRRCGWRRPGLAPRVSGPGRSLRCDGPQQGRVHRRARRPGLGRTCSTARFHMFVARSLNTFTD